MLHLPCHRAKLVLEYIIDKKAYTKSFQITNIYRTMSIAKFSARYSVTILLTRLLAKRTKAHRNHWKQISNIISLYALPYRVTVDGIFTIITTNIKGTFVDNFSQFGQELEKSGNIHVSSIFKLSNRRGYQIGLVVDKWREFQLQELVSHQIILVHHAVPKQFEEFYSTWKSLMNIVHVDVIATYKQYNI